MLNRDARDLPGYWDEPAAVLGEAPVLAPEPGVQPVCSPAGPGGERGYWVLAASDVAVEAVDAVAALAEVEAVDVAVAPVEVEVVGAAVAPVEVEVVDVAGAPVEVEVVGAAVALAVAEV